jgi:ectoine hydroxylase-related dioxygenase (phytanoyl-CoA dioxygenase family)
VHLDASTRDNGPLRLVPHSDTLGVLTDEEIKSAVDQRGFEECLVSRGGILVMRPLLIHSSSKVLTDAPRRVLHFENSDSLMLAPSIELAVA